MEGCYLSKCDVNMEGNKSENAALGGVKDVPVLFDGTT